MPNTTPAKVDGRRLRSDRSRQVIVESMLYLIEQGNLTPTAQQVANHAKVGIRSVFRHFEDMEAIFKTADDLWRNGFDENLKLPDAKLPLAQRIQQAAEQLGSAYEDNSNILKSTATRRWRSAFLQQNYASYQTRIRTDILRSLPEIEQLSNNKKEAIIGVLSFEYWDRMREHQALSAEASINLISELLQGLIPQ
ncbi:MAG: TetR/AcrR family transcriptional regulator [Porticoccaceae bacterium]|nr:TetR/AcrR family transcriptional regulator [Porticoccaceae bacterium]